MTTTQIVSILLLLALVSVHGNSAIESDRDEVSGILSFNGSRRRTHAYLPKFSKKGGKGKGAIYVEHDEHLQVYYYHKSHKKSKSSKKDKKDKKEKYVYVTEKPTEAPLPSTPTNNHTKSHSDDIHSPTTSGSEDCPPARPPTVVPPSNMNPTPVATTICPNNVKLVALDTYALDYTLSQTSAPSKTDFRQLRVATEKFFKDHMINAYKMSTQADLCDFTAPFVTAHFTPGEPIHVQYNSTAIFDADKSVNIPTSETLFMVLKQSLDSPQTYTDELKSKLGGDNLFSTTTNVVFTDPKATPTTRSTNTRSTSVFGIAGASAVMVMTLAIFVGVVGRRKEHKTDDNSFNNVFKKQGRCDTTVAGETFVSELNDSTYDGTVSILSSPSVSENNDLRRTELLGDGNKAIECQSISERTDDEIGPPQRRKPRTVAEIQTLLCSEGYDAGVI